MQNTQKAILSFLMLTASALSSMLEAQVIDLTGDPAFQPTSGSFVESQIPLSLKWVSSKRFLVASDTYSRCGDETDINKYVILSINPSTRSILGRRAIAAPPGSFSLITDANGRPILLSRSTIQVLDTESLSTIQTINLNRTDSDADAGRSADKDSHPCWWINFQVSATPNSKYITIAVPERNTGTTDLYQIDGETLKVMHTSLSGYLPGFRTGFQGLYEHKHRRQWNWDKGTDTLPICALCDFVDVLSGDEIVTTTDARVSVQNGEHVIWTTKFSGMRDGFDSDQKGSRFAIIAAEGNGLLRRTLNETLYIFDVPRRSVKRIQTWTVKQPGLVQGGGRSAVAFSPDGLQVVVFWNGQLTVISGF